MALKNDTTLLLTTLTFISILSLSTFILYNNKQLPTSQNSQNTPKDPNFTLKVFIFNLPTSLNYGLLQKYWSLPPDSRIPSDPDHSLSGYRHTDSDHPRYPENPVIKQYSAEYWLLGDLISDEEDRVVKRVFDESDADVIFVPFFASLSCEMQLSVDRGVFRKKVVENEDYVRQKMVVDLVLNSDGWKRSGGRDHVFVLTG